MLFRPDDGWDRWDALFAATALVISVTVQGSFPELIGGDGYFHVRAAERVLGGGMPWLPYSVFSDGWVDHQLGFHLAMAPFAWLLPGVLAAKMAAATFAAVAAIAMFRLLRRESCSAPWLFAALPFAISWMFLLRMEMPRTQSLSLALLIAVLGSLAAGRNRLTFGLCWAYAWTYHVSMIVLPVALLYAAAARLLGEPTERRQPLWRGPAAAAGGLTAGLLIHPHSPRTLRFVWQHVVRKVGNVDELPVGLEWTDGGAQWLVGVGSGDALVAGGGLLLLTWAIALGVRAGRRMAPVSLVLLCLAIGTTGAVAVAGTKFVEYSVPLSALALALTLRDSGLVPADWPRGLGARLGLGAALAALLAWTGLGLAPRVAASEPHPDELVEAAAFLHEQVPAGETVFHFHWNDFPELVFHAPEYRYIAGLDPHFLYLHDPERWRLYEAMGGAYDGLRSEAIAQTFGARWALLRLPHPGAREALAADPGLVKVFDDGEHAVIYAVRPSR